MVVVAIVGLLSSTILASLKTASLRAADAKIQEQVVALRQLMELERNDVGHYGNFKAAGAWKTSTSVCTAASFAGSAYAQKAADICNQIIQAGKASCGAYCLYFSNVAIPGLPPGTGLNQNNPNTVVSIQAYLPGKSYDAAAAGFTTPRYICLSTFSNTSIADGSAWVESGCQQNP